MRPSGLTLSGYSLQFQLHYALFVWRYHTFDGRDLPPSDEQRLPRRYGRKASNQYLGIRLLKTAL